MASPNHEGHPPKGWIRSGAPCWVLSVLYPRKVGGVSPGRTNMARGEESTREVWAQLITNVAEKSQCNTAKACQLMQPYTRSFPNTPAASPGLSLTCPTSSFHP